MAPPATTTAAEAQARFGRFVTTFVTIGFLAVIGAAAAAALVVVRANTHSAWVAHSYQVEQQLEVLSRQGATMRAEAVVAAYRHRQKSDQYYKAREGLFAALDKIAELTADNPIQQARIPILRRDYTVFKDMFDPPVSVDFMARLEKVEEVRREILPIRQQMVAEEHALLKQRLDSEVMSVHRFWIVLPLAGGLLVIVSVIAVLTIRKFTGDLATSKDQLEKLNAGLEDMVQDRTRDLQRANDEIQRFAYIVSHDLRSPLVNVMGFTAELDAARKQLEKFIEVAEEKAPEIVSDDARIAAREDLPEAIGFIRSSTQRMDRLINAILRLSREGRRTLMPEALDTTSIVQAAVDSLRHRVDELGIDIRVEGQLPTIICDRVAFEQIMANLIENATKYLAPGRPGVIRVSGSSRFGRALFEVKDNGRGVDPRDHERIFDLFRRSGVQDQPGEGIGLAHVRALAHRLGGTVDIASALGEGATFKVNLPVNFAGEKDKAA